MKSAWQGLTVVNSPTHPPHPHPATPPPPPPHDAMMMWHHCNKKCHDYVYVKESTKILSKKIKYYLKHENKVNEYKVLSYCEPLIYNEHNQKQWKLFSIVSNLQTHYHFKLDLDRETFFVKNVVYFP